MLYNSRLILWLDKNWQMIQTSEQSVSVTTCHVNDNINKSDKMIRLETRAHSGVSI